MSNGRNNFAWRIEPKMEITQHSQVLRSHLLKMAMMSQRAVDYSIKAYELNSCQLCLHARAADHELTRLRQCIGDRGRKLRAAGTAVDSDSLISCSAVRIYGALQVTYAAATEIAQNVMIILDDGRVTRSSEMGDIGKFVNSLVRLCTIALFKKEIDHAHTVLLMNEGRRRFDLALCQAHNFTIQGTDPHSVAERAIIGCLAQIAEQAYEIAEAIAMWIGGEDCLKLPDKRAA
jgi:phosphate transport system protein